VILTTSAHRLATCFLRCSTLAAVKFWTSHSFVARKVTKEEAGSQSSAADKRLQQNQSKLQECTGRQEDHLKRPDCFFFNKTRTWNSILQLFCFVYSTRFIKIATWKSSSYCRKLRTGSSHSPPRRGSKAAEASSWKLTSM